MAEESRQPPQPGAASEPARPSPRSRLLKRILPLAFIAFGILYVMRQSPRDVALVYHLPAQREAMTGLEIELKRLPDGAVARHAQFLYSQGHPAPAEQKHETRLVPGEYEVDATLVFPGRRDEVKRTFQLKREEQVDIQL